MMGPKADRCFHFGVPLAVWYLKVVARKRLSSANVLVFVQRELMEHARPRRLPAHDVEIALPGDRQPPPADRRTRIAATIGFVGADLANALHAVQALARRGHQAEVRIAPTGM